MPFDTSLQFVEQRTLIGSEIARRNVWQPKHGNTPRVSSQRRPRFDGTNDSIGYPGRTGKDISLG
jgi:hypothetical protein